MAELYWHHVNRQRPGEYELWVLKSRVGSPYGYNVMYLRYGIDCGVCGYRFDGSTEYVNMPTHLTLDEAKAVALTAYRMGA